jgi:glutamate synthase (NADPH/NADH) small chain
VCPALCEAACTLAINDEAVNIKHVEHQIVERAFAEGWIVPVVPEYRTGKTVGVVGSGPAGLAAAQQLARTGHEVVVFEKSNRIGGLLRYGIPDFKLEKRILDRRLEQMTAEGVKFEVDVAVGDDISPHYLRRMFDAVVLCMGAGEPRALGVPGAGYQGVCLAVDFLTQQNRRVAGDGDERLGTPLTARGKHVVVIGGGDTGSDCVGVSIRQGAKSVDQLEILPEPPEGRNPETPWPQWPKILRTSSSHEEGCRRRWGVLTKRLAGSMYDAKVTELHGCEVDWVQGSGGWEMRERPDADFVLPADLVLVAMGFVHVVHAGLIEKLGLRLDPRGNVAVDGWMTSEPGVFAAGDAVRGASLVVHAIQHGRLAAGAVDAWLKRVGSRG